jgi:outer membrane protein TolC
MSTNDQKTDETPQMNEQQIREWREKMTNYYNDQLPLLETQKKYETLLADIEEARARRMTMSIRLAQMMSGPDEEEEENTPAAPPEQPKEQPVERKLKVE